MKLLGRGLRPGSSPGVVNGNFRYYHGYPWRRFLILHSNWGEQAYMLLSVACLAFVLAGAIPRHLFHNAPRASGLDEQPCLLPLDERFLHEIKLGYFFLALAVAIHHRICIVDVANAAPFARLALDRIFRLRVPQDAILWIKRPPRSRSPTRITRDHSFGVRPAHRRHASDAAQILTSAEDIPDLLFSKS